MERAAAAHDRMTALVLRGGGVEEVAAAVTEVLGGRLVVLDADGRTLAAVGSDGSAAHFGASVLGPDGPVPLPDPAIVAEALASTSAPCPQDQELRRGRQDSQNPGRAQDHPGRPRRRHRWTRAT